MSDSTITGAGIPVPAESYCTPDGFTLFGAGISENPLTTDGGAQTIGYYTELFTASVFPPGTPVYALLYSSGTGLTELAQAAATTAATSGVIGLAIPGFNNGKGVPTAVVIGGPLTLTTAEWDAVVQGESGGLTTGTSYYLNSNGSQKPITSVQPDSDQWVNIGKAISPTTMIVSINGPTPG
jgi:hypothetical protein